MKYPNPCTRCGMCCLAEVCAVAMDLTGLPREGPCDWLTFTGDTAVCSLAPRVEELNPFVDVDELFGFGKGCCIKARAYKDGTEYDFATLPPELKIVGAKQTRRA